MNRTKTRMLLITLVIAIICAPIAAGGDVTINGEVFAHDLDHDNIIVSSRDGQYTCTPTCGRYSLTVPDNWSGRVVVFKNNAMVTPLYRDYADLTGNVYHQNYNLKKMFDIYVGHNLQSQGYFVDYNNDGHLDFIDAGGWSLRKSKQKSGMFLDPSPINNDYDFPRTSGMSIADFNLDGFADLAISDVSYYDMIFTGKVKKTRGILFDINSGSVLASDLLGASFSDCAAADYDNDGDPDLLISGQTGYYEGEPLAQEAQLYNNVNGDMHPVPSPFVPVDAASLAWGDYDNDGDLDLYSCGEYEFYEKSSSYLYENRNGELVSVNHVFAPYEGGYAQWADMDNDGDLDLVKSASIYGNDQPTRIYENDNGVFTAMPYNFGDNPRACTWVVAGDIDGDGDRDLISGTEFNQMPNQEPYRLTVYFNTGDDYIPQVLYDDDVTGYYPTLGDMNNNGRLDLAFSSATDVRFCYNDLPFTNRSPEPPTDLQAVHNGNSITFSWQPGSDNETPTPGLSYNIKVHDSEGNPVVESLSDPETGFRRVYGLGNVQHNTSWTIHNLPSDTYTYSVQTLDASYRGSEWAPEQTISHGIFSISGVVYDTSYQPLPGKRVRATNGGGTTISETHTGAYTVSVPKGWSGELYIEEDGIAYRPSNISFTDVSEDISGQNFVKWSPDIEPFKNAKAKWADYDSNGNMDLFICGESIEPVVNINGFVVGYDSVPATKVYANNNGTLTDLGNLGLPDVTDGDIEITYNKYDGLYFYLQTVAISGMDSDGNRVGGIYKTNYDGGSITFEKLVSPSLEMNSCDIEWVDYDSDGDDDLFACGLTDEEREVYLYENKGQFYVQVDLPVPGLDDVAAEWADYDNNGYPDLAISGYTGTDRVTKVYNNVGGNLTDSGLVMSQVAGGDIKWWDYDADGDCDLISSGWVGSPGPITEVFRNDNGALTLVPDNLPGMTDGMLDIADCNGDGKTDLAITGYSYDGGKTCKVFAYNGTSFDEIHVLEGIDHSCVSFGDLDGDWSPDLFIAGMTTSDTYYSSIVPIATEHPNTLPLAPTGLTTQPIGGGIKLQWLPGADADGPAEALHYNVRIGTTPGAQDILCSMTPSSLGNRLLLDFGNAKCQRSKLITNLSPGTYYWSVQSIDGSFAPSDWATESTFEVLPVSAHAAKQYSENTSLALEPMVCTYREPAMFYLENTDRTSGIRIQADRVPFGKGSIVAVTGVLKINDDGEVYIQSSDLSINGRGTIAPLLMNNRTIGGGTTGLQEKMAGWDTIWNEEIEDWERIWADEEGLSTVGLYVRTYGAFNYIDQYTFTIDDGYEVPIKCEVPPLAGIRLDQNWTYVVVNGVVSCERVGDELHRKILIDSSANITPITP